MSNINKLVMIMYSKLYNIKQLKNYIYENGTFDVSENIKLTEKSKLWLDREKERIKMLNTYEDKLYDNLNHVSIAGIDEVGRGPLAGPVLACCVIFPRNTFIPDINDSKKLKETKRELLSKIIKEKALAYGVGMVNNYCIDKINILNATYAAMQLAIKNAKYKIDYILVDAVHIPDITIKQKSIVKGDSKSISIAAASIIAKVTRDRIMENIDKIYPQYGFRHNKGYGTKEHIEAIKKYGPCPLHRKSFLKNIIGE